MTAEEFLNNLDEKQGTMWTEENSEICKAFIDFAKYHVALALEAASKHENHEDAFYESKKWWIHSDSILTSYSLENIK